MALVRSPASSLTVLATYMGRQRWGGHARGGTNMDVESYLKFRRTAAEAGNKPCSTLSPRHRMGRIHCSLPSYSTNRETFTARRNGAARLMWARCSNLVPQEQAGRQLSCTALPAGRTVDIRLPVWSWIRQAISMAPARLAARTARAQCSSYLQVAPRRCSTPSGANLETGPTLSRVWSSMRRAISMAPR